MCASIDDSPKSKSSRGAVQRAASRPCIVVTYGREIAAPTPGPKLGGHGDATTDEKTTASGPPPSAAVSAASSSTQSGAHTLHAFGSSTATGRTFSHVTRSTERA